jgi:hypothetical protein
MKKIPGRWYVTSWSEEAHRLKDGSTSLCDQICAPSGHWKEWNKTKPQTKCKQCLAQLPGDDDGAL